MLIIIGLGNPGQAYEHTRHNLGFLALDELARRLDLGNWQASPKLSAKIIKQGPLVVAKPTVFMNESGRTANAVLNFYGLGPKKLNILKGLQKNLEKSLIVIHDDLDIQLGSFRLSTNSSSAGHRGVASIINDLGTQNFSRLRLGIKTDAIGIVPAEKFVLERLPKEELAQAEQAIAAGLEEIILPKIKNAQNTA